MRILIFLLACICAVPAAAATLRTTDSPMCFATLEGVIETGDFARLSAALEENRPQDGTDANGEYFIPNRAVCLNSPGGSLPEAIRLAEYFFDNQYGTAVDDGASCLSACAVIFMMGTEDYADYNIVDRRLHVNGTLGFHRPAFSAPDRAAFNAVELEKSFNIAVDATLLFTRLASKSVRRGTGPMIHIGLMEEMFSHRGQDFYYIDTVDKAGRWDIALTGFEIPLEISLQEAQTACDNAINWALDLDSFGTGYLDSSYEPFWRAMLGRPDAETSHPKFEVYSRADLHSVISCVVHYDLDARDYREEGDWVSVCGATEDFCSLRDKDTAGGPGFRPEVILPSALPLRRVPEQIAAIIRRAAVRNTEWAQAEPGQCFFAAGDRKTVVNVGEFVNLREQPGFGAQVVAEAGKHLILEVAEDGAYVTGPSTGQKDCGRVCKTVGDGYEDGTRSDILDLKQCLTDNAIWYKVRMPESGTVGFVSGKYLR